VQYKRIHCAYTLYVQGHPGGDNQQLYTSRCVVYTHERSLSGARGAKPPPVSPDNSKMFTEGLQRTQTESES